MEYNVPHGKLIRAVVILEMVAHLHPRVASLKAPGPSTLPADFPHAINEASVLGWCIEFVSLIIYYSFHQYFQRFFVVVISDLSRST